MAHTIKCVHARCRCMIANEPGAPEFCGDYCAAHAEGTEEDAPCECGHDSCGRLIEIEAPSHAAG